jgi:N utilization substance protein A
MTPKKKTRKKQTRSKRAAVKKATPPKKRLAKKKPTRRKAAVKTKAVGKKRIGAKAVRAPKKRVRGGSQTADTVAFSLERPRARSGGQSGDLQGLSGIERADSESVGELLEEGNAFEADAVTGVEDAENEAEKEVRTHELPEDDVPGEYLEKD